MKGIRVQQINFTHIMCFYNRLLAINLCRFALGGQTVKNLRLLASKFELDQSQRKSSQVDASRRKWVAKRKASPKLASTYESVWPGLYTFGMSLPSPFPNHEVAICWRMSRGDERVNDVKYSTFQCTAPPLSRSPFSRVERMSKCSWVSVQTGSHLCDVWCDTTGIDCRYSMLKM